MFNSHQLINNDNFTNVLITKNVSHIMEHLLEQKIDINYICQKQTQYYGETILHICYHLQLYDIFKILVNLTNVNVNKKNIKEQTLLDIITNKYITHFIDISDYDKDIILLVLKAGGDPHTMNLLMIFIMRFDFNIIKILLDYGVGPNDYNTIISPLAFLIDRSVILYSYGILDIKNNNEQTIRLMEIQCILEEIKDKHITSEELINYLDIYKIPYSMNINDYIYELREYINTINYLIQKGASINQNIYYEYKMLTVKSLAKHPLIKKILESDISIL